MTHQSAEKRIRELELEIARLGDEITRLNQHLREVKMVADKYSQAFHGNRTSVAITRLKDSTFIDVNDTFLESLGFQKPEVIGKSPLELNVWADLTDREKIMNQISKDGYMRNFECKLRTKQGKIIFALIYSSIIEVDGDKCMLTAGIDITQRKKTEEDLKTANQMLQQEGPFRPEFLA